MDLNALRYFLVIAEEQHLTRAAERLQMAQPNLTRIMRKLEEELGFVLFERSNKRRFALTPAGETFLKQMSPMLKQYEKAVQAAKQVAQGEREKLVVGYTPVAMFNGVLPALMQIYQHFPEVELLPRDISAASRQMVLNMLHDGRLDVAFLPHGSEEPGLECELISMTTLVVVLPANHPLADQPAIPLAALAQEAWIQPSRSLNPRWHDDLAHLFQQAGFKQRVVHWTPQAHTLVSQVAAGLGLAILSTWTQQHLPHQGVVYRPLQDCEYMMEFHALWRKEDRSPLMQTFLRRCQSETEAS
ncbi:LysR family transcriptional regulator [Reticulibacter mediterranei]|uniref:LysR family transcriptional regulator n=1 Tax=Reticulibacter mediterranei TaxID=2778369 RepID=A0A8J3IM85_9CHLR|nr:LysR family transcriptional regulator [Reticulibacter mediterranei]GHO98159.1 LysR family transcriptional regulator [Reticulibacter mediterranei]